MKPDLGGRTRNRDTPNPSRRGSTAIPSARSAGNFHPEYELHYVVSTSGRYFVGDFLGPFEPGNLGADWPEPAAQLGERHRP